VADLTLVEFLEARLAEDAEAATDATPGPWAAVDPNKVWGDDMDHQLVGCGKNLATLRSEYRGYFNGLHIARWDPARVLAEVDAKRAMVDLLLADKHHVADDQWYTCPAATRERDGGTYAETDGGGRCTCRRDERVTAYLAVLAEAYGETT
jgi:Family of unknown function (DUF6221)